MGDGNWDPTTLEMGRAFAVIVRYRVGQKFHARGEPRLPLQPGGGRNRDDSPPL